MTQVQLQLEYQEQPVFDEVSAITAVVRPVLRGILNSLKQEVVDQAGGRNSLPLYMLARVRRPHDGEVGICFEYAVHDAITNHNHLILERVSDALAQCKVPGNQPASILFGAEKSGSVSLISTANELLTDESQLLYGTKGRPAKLKRHIQSVAAAFRKQDIRQELPRSISGLWKADLFSGCRDTDKWIGTTLKINREQLEGAKGLRLGIVPTQQGETDAIEFDDSRNLVVCPLPYDRSFMQAFYQAWEVVVHFLAADARIPKEASLPRPPSRQVARYLEDRRNYAVSDVIDALQPLSQPQLLRTQATQAPLVETRPHHASPATDSLLAPIPRSG